jgi:rSAM/selenodomain-associated transferase 2
VTLSVVIPAFDEEDRIADAVDSACAPGVEVIVVDGGSLDATRERAAASGARVVRSRKGRAAQLDAGVQSSQGDAIVFLHADTRLPSGYEVAVTRCLEAEGSVGGAFRFRFDQRSWGLRLIEWGVRIRVAWFGLPFGDQALFVRRDALAAAGGVPQVPIMEDLDLVRALRRQGRMSRLALPVTTSARRYRARGSTRTVVRNALAVAAWWLGIDRDRVAAWYAR